MTIQEQRQEIRAVLIQNFTTLCSLQLEQYREATDALVREMTARQNAEKRQRKPRKEKEPVK